VDFSLVSLPFGWHRSPVIFQGVLASYINVLDRGDILVMQYLDDILCVHTDAEQLGIFTERLSEHLVTCGFIISEAKWVFEPANMISWLGKVLDSADGHISIAVAESAFIEVCSLACLAVSSRRRQAMRSLVGVLGWLGCDGRVVFPYLQLIHKWQLWVGRKGRNNLLYVIVPQLVRGLGLVRESVRLPPFVMGRFSEFSAFDNVWFVDA